MSKAIHAIATTIAATAILLPYLPSSLAGYLIYISLCGVVIIAALAIASLFCLVKKKSIGWLYTTLLAASILSYGKNHIPGGTDSNETRGLCIVSWNARNFQITNDTLQKAAALINNLNADIICLQERPHDNLLHRDSIKAAFPGYPHFFTNDREDEVLNIAILSKYPLSNTKIEYFDPGYNKMVRADVATPWDTITLWNVHLQTTGGNPLHFIPNAKRRNWQAQNLKNETDTSKHPALVCGDFNDTPSSYTYRTLTNRLTDCYTVAGDRYDGSYQPLGGIVRIDYILCSRQWQPQSYRLIENPWSDHKIQVATLTLKNNTR